MSDTDSFIEEVTEEVRRDRLYGMFRRYGWIGVAGVVLIVGGAAFNEWRKSKAETLAQNTGDAMFAAVEANDNASRIAALKAIDSPSPEVESVVDMLIAAHEASDGEALAASETYGKVAQTQADMPEIYRQIAAFKSVTVAGPEKPIEERRIILESMAAPGAPLSLLAQEQLALLDLEEGQTDAAIDRLQLILSDAGATAGLLQRASQLIVALGGQPQAISAPVAGQ